MGIDKKESVLLLIFQSEACTGHGAAAAAVVVQYLDDPRVGPIQFQRRLLHSADGAIREWGKRERGKQLKKESLNGGGTELTGFFIGE